MSHYPNMQVRRFHEHVTQQILSCRCGIATIWPDLGQILCHIALGGILITASRLFPAASINHLFFMCSNSQHQLSRQCPTRTHACPQAARTKPVHIAPLLFFHQQDRESIMGLPTIHSCELLAAWSYMSGAPVLCNSGLRSVERRFYAQVVPGPQFWECKPLGTQVF